MLGGNGVGGNRGSVTAGCPSERDRQTPYRQRDATSLSCSRKTKAAQHLHDSTVSLSRCPTTSDRHVKKRSETVPPHQRPPHQRIPIFSSVLTVFCSMPGVDPHVPHILWIEFAENWDKHLLRLFLEMSSRGKKKTSK